MGEIKSPISRDLYSLRSIYSNPIGHFIISSYIYILIISMCTLSIRTCRIFLLNYLFSRV